MCEKLKGGEIVCSVKRKLDEIHCPSARWKGDSVSSAGRLLIKVTSGEFYRNACVNLTCWRSEICPVDAESKQECVGAVLELERVCQVG